MLNVDNASLIVALADAFVCGRESGLDEDATCDREEAAAVRAYEVKHIVRIAGNMGVVLSTEEVSAVLEENGAWATSVES